MTRSTILVNNKLIIYTHSTDFTRTKIISREGDSIQIGSMEHLTKYIYIHPQA